MGTRHKLQSQGDSSQEEREISAIMTNDGFSCEKCFVNIGSLDSPRVEIQSIWRGGEER